LKEKIFITMNRDLLYLLPNTILTEGIAVAMVAGIVLLKSLPKPLQRRGLKAQNKLYLICYEKENKKRNSKKYS
jgi:hypothetical protein